MNIWRRSIQQTQQPTPTPTPTPIPSWDYNLKLFEKYPNFSRKVQNNQDVSTSSLDRYFSDNSILRPYYYKKAFDAYNSNDELLTNYCSECGISRLYTFKPNVGGEWNYNKNYDDNTQYTSGNQVAYYCVYWLSNMALSIPYLGLYTTLANSRFYRNIPNNIPILPPEDVNVIYYKNGIYRGTKETITPPTPIPPENTLLRGFKIGTNTTLYDLHGPSAQASGSNRAEYPIQQMGTGSYSVPWINFTANTRYIAECGGNNNTIPAYVKRNGYVYPPSYFYGLKIPFIPLQYLQFNAYTLSTVQYYVQGFIIASTNFHVQEKSVERG